MRYKRVLENTQVEALELLRPPSPPPPLTWAEILEDDPYSDEDIWKDIDYGADSSGDEKIPKKRRKAPSTPPTSFDEDDTFDPEACVTSTDKDEPVPNRQHEQHLPQFDLPG